MQLKKSVPYCKVGDHSSWIYQDVTGFKLLDSNALEFKIVLIIRIPTQ